ncbi:MAG: D-glycero-beta-D-manno-heptose-7-phosphate kinase [Nitrospirota bacterium]
MTNSLHFEEIINNFPKTNIFILGDIMMDHYIWGKVSRISPEAPVPVVEVARETLLLGGAANVLNNILSLNGKVMIGGVIGHDDMGRKIIHDLRQKGVHTEGIVVESDRPTTVKTRIIAHSQQVVRFDRESRGEINGSTRDIILTYVSNNITEIDAVIISDYSKGVVTQALIDGILQLTNKKGVPVTVDPKVNHFPLYKGITLITPNNLEASMATGIEINNEDTLIKAGRILIERLGCKAVLITRGEEGMSLFEDNGEITHISTVASEVYDVTGAGDTVIATSTLAISAGATFKEAATIANHAAGIVVGKVGTATVKIEELRRSLQIR